MAKVLVERERLGGKYSRRGRPARKHSDLPKKESMKRPHKDRKILNENLSPLKRFLKSQVGRPWNKVFSEICENIKLTSAVQKHVRDHVFDYVQLNIRIEGKKIISQRRFGSYELFNGDFFVDPKTGNLKEYRRPRIKRPLVKRNPLEESLNRLIGERTVRVEIEEDQVYRIETSKKNSEESSRSLAKASNARVDAKMVTSSRLQSDIQNFISKYTILRKSNNEYLRTFIECLQKGLEKRTVGSVLLMAATD